MWFSRTHWILNHCLRRLRVCRHVRMTWGAIICITPVTTGSWVCRVATSIPICWVVIPGPLVSVIAIRWKAMCWICWNKSKEQGVNSLYLMRECIICWNRRIICRKGPVLTLCCACGSVCRHHAGVFSSHLENDTQQEVGREQENNFSFLTRDIVGRCRALRTYLWRSGGSNYHFHFRRLVSVMTIFCNSTTFLNLQSGTTISGKIVSRYLTVSSRLSVNFFAASNPAAFGWL